jgi:DNA-binding response OmpR family regulator
MTGPAHVLIVDDEPNIVLSLEFLLQQKGYRISLASDGDAAWRTLLAEPPDLVLLDVMLPGLDGFEICRRLRGDRRFDRTRIILLTARGREVDRLQGEDLGADLYITKPFSTRELVQEVERCLQAADG